MPFHKVYSEMVSHAQSTFSILPRINTTFEPSCFFPSSPPLLFIERLLGPPPSLFVIHNCSIFFSPFDHVCLVVFRVCHGRSHSRYFFYCLYPVSLHPILTLGDSSDSFLVLFFFSLDSQFLLRLFPSFRFCHFAVGSLSLTYGLLC